MLDDPASEWRPAGACLALEAMTEDRNSEPESRFLTRNRDDLEQTIRRIAKEEIVQAFSDIGIDTSVFSGKDAHRRKVDFLSDLFAKRERLQAHMDFVEKAIASRQKFGEETRKSAFDLVRQVLGAGLIFLLGVISAIFYGSHK